MDSADLRFLGLGAAFNGPALELQRRVRPPLQPPVPLRFSGHRGLRFCTWNVLAPSYALHKSFPDVDREHLKTAHRLPLQREVLAQVDADVFCLQEIENSEQWQEHLAGLGYGTAFAPRPNRADGCLIAWRLNRLKCCGQLLVDFDEVLASQSLAPAVFARFARKNVALVVELDLGDARFLVATTHLYWGSEHEDVRVWQLQTLLEAASSFGHQPLALCGDLNLLPGGDAYKLLRNGSLDVPQRFQNVERFLVDRDISKAAKPLRLLGLDVVVESPEERLQRPEAAQGLRAAKLPVVTRAARERRVLVSASKRLVVRADAALAYFLDARDFERSLAQLCVDLSVDLGEEHFFTRCVKCNGRVFPLADTAQENERAAAFGAPGSVPLFTCAQCGQIYWFSHDEGSASARARLQVETLVKLVGQLKTESTGDVHKDTQDGSAEFLRNGGGRLRHDWKLCSAYEDVELQSEAVVSNSKYGFHGCIDYIWLSSDFCPQGRLQLPTCCQLQEDPEKPLPSLVSRGWPSDHWPLASDLGLRKKACGLSHVLEK
ncbi:unnamed protein product [Effrenium voratum]|uniref:Mut7-C RNAse domain-containing protein n=1 Tax=Effrenium voratum TaxID=2562239 RepID=A0AA36HXD8_9DINO|nr:unnamed protein product [Effrenium voratum]CAJ1445553.1 unnamed protein product [Effrenium voratum]